VFGDLRNDGQGSNVPGLFVVLAKDGIGATWHPPLCIASGEGFDVALTASLRVNNDLLIVFGDADSQTLKAALFRNFQAF
jgi:hypothetical protein